MGQIWLYWLAPVAGGVLACVTYRAIHVLDAKVKAEA